MFLIKEKGDIINQKEFLTIKEQIQRIKSYNIVIKNEKKAKELLEKNSFYNIINGYREPFYFNNRKNKYIKGTSFEEIFALYEFDRKLRNLLFPTLLDIENAIKSEIIYEFLKTTDAKRNLINDKDNYLKISSYNLGNNDRIKYNLALNLISDLQNIISNYFKNSDSISHYLINYGYVPLWVLSTKMTFTNISKFYQCMIGKNRQAIAKKYTMADDDFETILKLLTIARNYCAHYNRIYNFSTNIILPTPNKSIYPLQYQFITNSKNKENGLFNIIITMKYFISSKNYKAFINSIDTLIKELEKKLSTIKIDDILKIMGFPPNWIDIKK